MNEKTLIDQYLHDGDVHAARELLAPHEKNLYRYLWQMLKSDQDSEDALQDTLRKALEALPRYREESHFKSWLYRIGHNVALDQIRRRKKVVYLDPTESQDSICSENDTPDHQLMKQERHQELHEAISSLSDHEREVVMLRFQADLSFKEIALITDCPLGTILARMSRAKQHLKAQLQATG